MGCIFVCLEYDREWKNLNSCWEWVGSGLARGFNPTRFLPSESYFFHSDATIYLSNDLFMKIL